MRTSMTLAPTRRVVRRPVQANHPSDHWPSDNIDADRSQTCLGASLEHGATTEADSSVSPAEDIAEMHAILDSIKIEP
jgi:hypothetical protein